ncbi:MAG: sulfite exporter TauE/SafE family protein [bacterium]
MEIKINKSFFNLNINNVSSFLLVLLGILIGSMVGITGASGVLIMVPILSSFTNLPMPIILGTSLMVDVIVSFSVTTTYASFRNVKTKGIQWILFGSFIGAQIGSLFVVAIPKVIIILIIVIGMIGFGLRMLKDKVSSEKGSETLGKPLPMFIWGIIVGLTTGLFGAGGGIMTFLMLRYFLKFSTKKAIGTSTLIMLITAIFGVAGYILNSNLDFKLSLIIGVPAFIAGMIISAIANKINDNVLNRVIGMTFIISALFMLVSKIIIPLFGI